MIQDVTLSSTALTIMAAVVGALITTIGILWRYLLKVLKEKDAIQEARIQENKQAQADARALTREVVDTVEKVHELFDFSNNYKNGR